MRRRLILVLSLLWLLAVSQASTEPITGAAFDSLMAAQDTVQQHRIADYILGVPGCFVTGPLDPLYDEDPDRQLLFGSIRVICGDSDLQLCLYSIHHSEYYDSLDTPDFRPLAAPTPHGGRLYRSQRQYRDSVVQLCTVAENRYLVWLHSAIQAGWLEADAQARSSYEEAVSEYLLQGPAAGSSPPAAGDFGLPERFDLYAEPPDYVIQGYKNYKDFLYSHAELTTKFATGIAAFVPTAETLERMKENAPREAYPNKESAKLQEEYREFFERGGDPRVMQTLTKEGFDTLKTGEYFFAVGLNGTIRFGRELMREEVERIEKETGREVPRANHAFLFPGEPVLTAGAFFIDERAENKLVKVNAQSGHYFYSNISPTIREDIAERSDHYLLTLGHFFIVLDRLGINYDGILISKL